MNRTPRPPTAASWPKGTSGNPRGRPKGSSKSADLRHAIDEHLPDIIEKLVELALDGDVQAIRVLIDRRLPPLKAVSVPVTMDMPAGAALSARGNAVLDAMARGALGVAEGCQVLTAIAAHARALETSELQARVSKLEAVLDSRGLGHDRAG